MVVRGGSGGDGREIEAIAGEAAFAPSICRRAALRYLC